MELALDKRQLPGRDADVSGSLPAMGLPLGALVLA